jgi:ribose 5-phosphate isomerase A
MGLDGKRAAGEAAVALVTDGMRLGLGTGSTVYWTLRALAERVGAGLHVVGAATSRETERLAHELGIPLAAIDDIGPLDLGIDGADEVSPALDLIKGGGGALLREKLVALQCRTRIIVVDSTKLVRRLGARPVPVEVVAFGWRATAARLAAEGGRPRLRTTADGQPFVTDEGHHILDCAFPPIDEPEALARTLKALPGVVESGLFVGLADVVLVGSADGVEALRRGKEGS